MAEYANIIVDIFNEKLDKTFQYRIPEAMKEKLTLGMQVYVPFGKRNIKGYVVELTDEPEFEVAKIKEIIGIVTDSVPIESQLIALAGWMKKNYGATMNHALKTVIPIKKKSNAVEHKSVRLKLTEIEAKSELAEFERKHQKARVRLLSALIENPQMDQSMITQKLNVSGAVIRALETMGIVEVVSERSYRNPVSHLDSKGYHLTLNEEQQSVVDVIERNLDQKIAKTYLIKGVTGSGKYRHEGGQRYHQFSHAVLLANYPPGHAPSILPIALSAYAATLPSSAFRAAALSVRMRSAASCRIARASAPADSRCCRASCSPAFLAASREDAICALA